MNDTHMEIVEQIEKQDQQKKKKCQINYRERLQIEKMTQQEEKVAVIAQKLGRSRCCVYMELKRGGTPYSAEVAQRKVQF